MVSQVDVSLGFRPFAHQRAAHALRLAIRFLVLVWHRRAGKTVFAIVELVVAALSCTRERGRYGYICPQLKQAKGVAWDYLKAFAKQIPHTVVNEAELWVEFPNGSRVRLFGADNPDSLRGFYFDGIVMDEVADMRPQVWGEIIRPALADREGWAIFIGTPKGVNLFSELYYRAQEEDGWGTDLRRASETGVLSDTELAKARVEMSEAQYAQEMDCDFAASAENVLLKLDQVLAAQKRTVPESEYFYAPKVLGVDVACYGKDRSAIVPRQGCVALKPEVHRGLDTMELASAVAMLADRWAAEVIFVDQTGIGAGTTHRLRQLGYNVIGVDFGGKPVDPRFENKRAEMWWTMADWVKTTGCLPNLPDLAKELTAPTYTYRNKRGRLQLESKDEMRARGLPSPDVADGLACTFHTPLAPRGLQLPKHLQRKDEQRGDYDPFARSGGDYDPYSERNT